MAKSKNWTSPATTESDYRARSDLFAAALDLFELIDREHVEQDLGSYKDSKELKNTRIVLRRLVRNYKFYADNVAAGRDAILGPDLPAKGPDGVKGQDAATEEDNHA